ncbi:MAG: S41 family peptidase [Lachnospiraceae bacterium]
MKKFLQLILFYVCLMLGVSGFSGAVLAGEPAYTEKSVKVYRNKGLTDETIPIRYFNTRPHVPYVGIRSYYDVVMKNSLDPKHTAIKAAKQDDGSYLLTNAYGSAVVDTEKDLMSSDNMLAFLNLMSLIQADMPEGYSDGMPYVRVKEIRAEGSPAVRFDFSAYGIDLIADGEDIWFPHATLSNIFSDLFYHHTEFNGKYLYYIEDNEVYLGGKMDTDYAVPIPISLYENSGKTRPADLVQQTYADLCFALQNFYGYPKRNMIGTELKTRGLDAALLSQGEAGKKTKELLLSSDPLEFALGMTKLDLFMNDGGHTSISTGIPLLKFSAEDNARAQKLAGDLAPVYEELEKKSKALRMPEGSFEGRVNLRRQTYSDPLYIKDGDLAIGILDSFSNYDLAAWKDYYAGKGERPKLGSTKKDDDMVTFLSTLERAANDPEVKNYIVDVTNNRGGSLDIVVAVYALITGKREVAVPMENTLTGQRISQIFEVDRNFDRVFDEKDAQPLYDLNFFVETSCSSFSAGNEFPFMMKDAGYKILGEPSGGGSCAIMMNTTDDGLPYQISSWRSRLTDISGKDVDSGVPVDVDLRLKNADGSIRVAKDPDSGESLGYNDYSLFYDLGELHAAVENRAAEPRIRTHSLSLSGTIGLNFYMYLPERSDIDYKTSYMDFTLCGKTRRAAFDENRKNKDGTLYGFTCPVNSVQMADKITAVYHYFTKDGKEKTFTETYAVDTYLQDFTRMDNSGDSKATTLVRAIGDYGYYAQPYLSRLRGWTLEKDHAAMSIGFSSDYSDTQLEEARTALTGKGISVQKNRDIAKVTYSLNLDADTAIFLYFQPADGYNGSVSATVGGKDANVELLSDGRYRVAIRDIAAHRLGDTAEVILSTSSGASTMNVSALSFVKACLDEPRDDDEKRAMCALFYYYKAAAAYLA